MQKYEEAIAAYDQAWYGRGNALFNLNQYKEALTSYDKALNFKSDYSEALKARNAVLAVLKSQQDKVGIVVSNE